MLHLGLHIISIGLLIAILVQVSKNRKEKFRVSPPTDNTGRGRTHRYHHEE